MDVTAQIEAYLGALPEPKQGEVQQLHRLILQSQPGCELWFHDGKDETGKVVSNPNIGYGRYTIRYANGTSKDFYRVGLSANASGISVYVMGYDDKARLAQTLGQDFGKASVTGYCIKFKRLGDIKTEALRNAIHDRFSAEN